MKRYLPENCSPGNSFSGYISLDGKTWTAERHTADISGIADAVDLGLAAGGPDKRQYWIEWENRGRILSYSDSTDWDVNQKAGYISLQNFDWEGKYELNKFQNKYCMSYLG